MASGHATCVGRRSLAQHVGACVVPRLPGDFGGKITLTVAWAATNGPMGGGNDTVENTTPSTTIMATLSVAKETLP